MRILLVRPWVNKKITTVKNFLFGEPLGVECVATILKEQGHKVVLADFMAEPKGNLMHYMKRIKPQVIGVTSQCTDVENVLKIAEMAKRYDKDIKVIVGGVQAMVYPNSFFNSYVDHVFKSTTRENYRELMELIASGEKQKKAIVGIFSKELSFKNSVEGCYNEYIKPDRDCSKRYRHLYRYVGFQPCAIIQTSFGCRNRCRFCVRWKLEGPILREVELEKIIEQLEELEEPYIMICDNDFLINRKRLENFCNLLEKRKIKKKYICYGSVNSILEKEDLFKRLARNGLIAVIVGYESFDNKQLKEYNKAANTDENLRATRVLQKNKIACWGSFILHPDWDKKDFRKLLQYKKLLKPELVTFSPLNPHPLTPLFEEYRDRLLYDETDYEKWNFGDVLIIPSKMSLNAYYLEVLKFTFAVNMNLHSVFYTLRAFPISNTLRMTFGFNTLISVYIKNFFKATLINKRRRA